MLLSSEATIRGRVSERHRISDPFSQRPNLTRRLERFSSSFQEALPAECTRENRLRRSPDRARKYQRAAPAEDVLGTKQKEQIKPENPASVA
jgi:hypothetical protein